MVSYCMCLVQWVCSLPGNALDFPISIWERLLWVEVGRNYLNELVRKVGDGSCFDEGIVGLGKQCGELTSPLVTRPTGSQGCSLCWPVHLWRVQWWNEGACWYFNGDWTSGLAIVVGDVICYNPRQQTACMWQIWKSWRIHVLSVVKWPKLRRGYLLPLLWTSEYFSAHIISNLILMHAW